MKKGYYTKSVDKSAFVLLKNVFLRKQINKNILHPMISMYRSSAKYPNWAQKEK
jgi:hypothetical protein